MIKRIMSKVADIAAFLELLAPTRLAEAWDNVGLLVGDDHSDVKRVMTCLTITPASAAEAIECRADLIVSHHPLPFQAVKRITTDTPTGCMLWSLIGHSISIYSLHTAFDSAAEGINHHLAEGLGLRDVAVLVENANADASVIEGGGRWGWFDEPVTLEELADRVKQFLKIERLQVVGRIDRAVRSVAVACGSAGEFLGSARSAGCQCLVTGETR
ncbi:MAG TPA: Nif3-like dinuclear metal center hexameric protein, partial [Pirellulales bacterium]|nr:Nif3-like dinuclear metal center hexameric protein [Pirellulales bacterium]